MPPKQSPAWNYFNKSGSGRAIMAQGKKCPAKYTNPATSVLYYHLEKVHHLVWDKLQPKKKPHRAPARTESEDFEDVDDPEQGKDGSATGAGAAVTRGARPTSSAPAGSEAGATSSSETPEAQATVTRQGSGSFGNEGPLDRCINNAADCARGATRDEEVTNALLYMVAHDNMPSSTVERKGFRVYTRALQQRYNVPSEPTLTKRLEL
ncbi:E3 SUMO-protein ligase ZBED1 [Frankliniella fusca]|uniref:E3 SUMO-protein ligase ZBED1 n=1 Tax=Frankliniella fusca TaxID=407009 RepID=A0AAE1GXR5_9NEOP|nr:E3 SUMO-protein ligase ZBED1 [Frankliniella fusca]